MQNPKNKKPGRGERHEPGLRDTKNQDSQNSTECRSESQQSIALIPFLGRLEGYLKPLPELRPDEILDKFTRTKVENVSAPSSHIETILVLTQAGFTFECLEWSDSSACAVGWSPGTNGRRGIAPENLIVAYVLGRTQLELFFAHVKKQVTSGWFLQ